MYGIKSIFLTVAVSLKRLGKIFSSPTNDIEANFALYENITQMTGKIVLFVLNTCSVSTT